MQNLSQRDADLLIAMPKYRVNRKVWDHPICGGRVNIPLMSENRSYLFFLDISTSKYRLTKKKYQNRIDNIVLVRLEIDGRKHRNPDGTIIGPNHIHTYREGFGTKWAFNLPFPGFMHLNDPEKIFFDFMNYCSIVEIPLFNGGIFS